MSEKISLDSSAIFPFLFDWAYMRPALTRQLLSRNNLLNSRPIHGIGFSVVARSHRLPAEMLLGCSYVTSIKYCRRLFSIK